MTDTKERAVWKTYPEISFLQANQFGEVRTIDHYTACKDGSKRFYKGHVLKQYVDKKGYILVHPCVNGKQVNLLVHRIVATCFLPNPDNLPEINHKDSDPTNNTVNNLEWCTHEYNVAYKEKYGKSAAEVSGRPVYAVNLKTSEVSFFKTHSEAACQLGINCNNISCVLSGRCKQTGGYWFSEDENKITEEKMREIKNDAKFRDGVFAVDLKTKKVLFFESQCEAAQQLGVDDSIVNMVLKGRKNQAGGYWFTKDKDEINKEKIQEIKDNMYFLGGVMAVNLKTIEVSHFESQKEAAQQLSIRKGNINDVLKGRLKKTHGCWFCYADENAIENTRAKFGDEVACEVEKLLSGEL